MHKLHRQSLVLMPLLIAGLGACSSSGSDYRAQPAPGAMPDASIAGVVTTANQSEIELGRLALSNSRNEAVRQYAQRMVEDHTNADRQFRAAMSQLNLATANSPTATQLDDNSTKTAQRLRTLSGTEFDRAYMDNQNATHEWLLRTLDQTLIPSAQNTAIEDQLRSLRTTVAMHLDWGRTVRRGLN